MNVDYLISITDSVEEFFNENFDLSLHRKEIELHSSFSNIEDGIFLDLKGSVEGKILLNYSFQFEKYLSSFFFPDLDEENSEELQLATLKEFLNQLSGYIVTRAELLGYDWDVGVPCFIENGLPRLDTINLETVVIPYFNEKIGNVKIKIAMRDL